MIILAKYWKIRKCYIRKAYNARVRASYSNNQISRRILYKKAKAFHYLGDKIYYDAVTVYFGSNAGFSYVTGEVYTCDIISRPAIPLSEIING